MTHTPPKRWNWQQSDWPRFQYDPAPLKALEDNFLGHAGLFAGAHLHVSENEKRYLAIELASEEALKTSEIENEILRRDSIRSLLDKHVAKQTKARGVPCTLRRRRYTNDAATQVCLATSAEAGVAEMIVDLYLHFQKPLTHKMLFAWHRMIMKGRTDIEFVGTYRQHPQPMQVISGPFGEPKVHFEAPPAKQVPHEMDQFIEWFNATAPGGKTPLPTLTRASIVHLYFESIHPFEDGNGRVGRALVEKSIGQYTGRPPLLALSQTIMSERKRYYQMLESSNKSNQIDGWLTYFAQTILAAQARSQKHVDFVIQKTKFYERFRDHLNDRQQKVVARIFREGLDGFQGGLSAENYITITKTSRATATRDLNDLVEKGAFTKTGVGKGTRYALVLQSPVRPGVGDIFGIFG